MMYQTTGDPMHYPIHSDLDFIEVGDIFRVERIEINFDDSHRDDIKINILASFTGYQSHASDGSVRILVTIIGIYDPPNLDPVIGEVIIGEDIWVVKTHPYQENVRTLLELIHEVENPGPKVWS